MLICTKNKDVPATNTSSGLHVEALTEEEFLNIIKVLNAIRIDTLYLR